MMKTAKRPKMSGKKKAAVAAGAVAGVLLIAVLCGWLLMNGYLDKIKYASGNSGMVSSIAPDTDASAASDSPQSDIDALNKKAEANLKNSSTPLMYDEDVFNVLLIGSDSRTAGGRGRSDSMILISINRKTSKIVVTSLLRDIYLQIPGISEGNRLNAANAYGGPSLLLSTIQQNFKIKVDKYIAVDFFSFMDLIDKVGGVTVNVSAAEMKVANDYITELNGLKGLDKNDGKLTKAGEQNLTGKQALGYARIRYVGNGDFGRTDRQRIILEQVFSKIKSRNLFQLNDLLNTFLPEVTTNLTKGELSSMVLSLPTYAGYGVDSWHLPAEGTFSYLTVRKMSVLGIDFDKNIAELKKKIYG